ncbi:hypothetical protein LIS04_19 [Listeria phage LIS04]|nr:hypothetical protein LIS04_19 [Listeria phage LIS04]
MIKRVQEVTQSSNVSGFKLDQEVGQQMTTGLARYEDRNQEFIWKFESGEDAQRFIEAVAMAHPEVELYGPYEPRIPNPEALGKFLVTLIVPATEAKAEELDKLIIDMFKTTNNRVARRTEEAFSFKKLLSESAEEVAVPASYLNFIVEPAVLDDLFQDLVTLVNDHNIKSQVTLNKSTQIKSEHQNTQIEILFVDNYLRFNEFEEAKDFLGSLNAVLSKHSALTNGRTSVRATITANYSEIGELSVRMQLIN